MTSPDPVARLRGMATAIQRLGDTAPTDQAPFEAVAAQVVDIVASEFDGVDAVSITMLGWPEPRTSACTDAWAWDLDLLQYVSGRGPCLEAAESHLPVVMDTNTDGRRWPEVAHTAALGGVRASLSVPLVVRGPDEEQDMECSLNIYSRTDAPFSPYDQSLMCVLTAAAGQAIGHAVSRARGATLEDVLSARAEIEVAKGVLMACDGCTMDAASARLTDQSQRRDVDRHTVARDLLGAMQPLIRRGPHPSTHC